MVALMSAPTLPQLNRNDQTGIDAPMPLIAHPPLPLTRRTVLNGLGLALTAPLIRPAAAQAPGTLTIRLGLGTLPLRAGAPPSAVALVETAPRLPRFRQGDTIALTVANALTSPAVLNWRGLDGVPAAAPVAAIPPGGETALTLPLRHAGTLLGEITPADGSLPAAAFAVVVDEKATPDVDRDESLLIEEWRVRGDGHAIAAGQDSSNASNAFTVNRKSTLKLSAAPNSRLRLRFINGSQRSVIAIRIPDRAIHIVAIDSRPAEPYIAHNSQLVLAPGSRVDTIIDVTQPPGSTAPILLHDGQELRTIGTLFCTEQPAIRATSLPTPASLPTEGLPENLDLARAVRVELPLDSPPWTPSAVDAAEPVFRAKRGRTVTLTIKNAGQRPMIFRLQGHHARLLDRLDDGWKPYWVDTLPVRSGTTERLAFLAEFSGEYRLETSLLAWDAPRLTASYVIE